MTFATGTLLGAYEIVGPLGAGGMGEVYRARDNKLKREVALKVLPAEFSRDPERESRFQREAEALAALNHPNIASIYDFQKANGSSVLVMELVEGETLAERLKQGALQVADTLEIARQVCEALEAAHEKGFIHRDLKPANIKINPDGKVKLLDFGLVRMFEPASANVDLSNSPTMMSQTMTGVILGTAAYMSPEQARGKTVDKRADIWAFGAVLFEMLTCQQAFRGEDVADILGAVLKTEPDWTMLPPDLPPRVRELLSLCLQKDPKKRRRDAGDLRIDIDQALAEPRITLSGHSDRQPHPFWKRAAAAVAVLLLVAVVTGMTIRGLSPEPPPPVVTRFSLPLGEGQTFTGAANRLVAISPDGTQIVYVANNRLYLRRMGELDVQSIPGSEGHTVIRNPVFSPDGNFIAFFGDGTLKRISTSGDAISLCDAELPMGMSWSEDGILYSQANRIMRVPSNGGNPETLITLSNGEVAHSPEMLPGGRSVLFTVTSGTATNDPDQAKVVVQAMGSSERKILIDGGSEGRYISTGHLVYATSGTLRAVAFNLDRLEVTSAPVPVVEGVRRNTNVAHFSFSANGSLVYVPGPVDSSRSQSVIRLTDREGNATSLNLPPRDYSVPRVSPDGRRVALQTDDDKDSILWIYDLSGDNSLRRLTFGGKNRKPVWSPDSKWVAFQSDREGDLAIFRQPADGSGTAERVTRPDADTAHFPDSWSPDGTTLLYEVAKANSRSLWVFSFRDQKSTAFAPIQNTNPFDAVFSPDGRWVAYTSQETGKNEIFVQPFPPTGAKYQLPEGADNHAPLWFPDGNELFYVPGPGLTRVVRVTLEPGFAVSNATNAFQRAILNAPTVSRDGDMMPDGNRIIGVVTENETRREVQVILNWFEELKQRVPSGS